MLLQPAVGGRQHQAQQAQVPQQGLDIAVERAGPIALGGTGADALAQGAGIQAGLPAQPAVSVSRTTAPELLEYR